MTKAVTTAPRAIAISAEVFRAGMLSYFGHGLVETNPAYAILEYRSTARYPWQVELADIAARALADGSPGALDGLRLELRAAIR